MHRLALRRLSAHPSSGRALLAGLTGGRQVTPIPILGLTARAFSVSRVRAAGGGGGGGQPLGNIFGQQAPAPGQALKDNGIDLTALAREGKLDPVIGRDETIRRVIQILSRRTKNNPVLIGNAGVGKTAIAEGLSQRIVANEVPESLKNRRVVSIDLASLMSGSGIRGSFEEKIKALLKDIETEKDSVIVFIDEIHQLLGLGKAEGSLDAGNMLKPALARGLQLVGATTPAEFARTIEKDAALSRRFQVVQVDEPSVEETITMLRGLKRKYELHHSVTISDAALVTAATYSNRYITDRQLPDKAIDLIDEAASSLRLKRESRPEELEHLSHALMTAQIELTSLGGDSDAVSAARREVLQAEIKRMAAERDAMEDAWKKQRERGEEVNRIREELEDAKWELEESQRTGNFQRASELRYAVIPNLLRRLPEEEEGQVQESGGLGDRVTSDDVSRVVAKMTGIPLSSLVRGDRSRLLSLEDTLRQRVIGQEPALHAVAEAIRLSRAGLQNTNRPIASFLFLGATGTGKTELAKTLAGELTGTEKNIITINMSEFSERHTVSRLIGAAPGYVGYEDSGQLTEAVRRKPYSVVLLDEFVLFEKAARPEVPNMFLQVLDEGVLRDSQGRRIDFKNCTLILTSNIGSDILMRPGATLPDGTVTDEAKKEILMRVQQMYPPELLNRLDEQIVFNSLSPESIAKIVDLRIREVEQALNSSSADRHIDLSVGDDARKWLVETGFSPVWGAREINRLVNKQVRQPLASAILRGTIKNGDVARVVVKPDRSGLMVEDVHEPETEPVDGSGVAEKQGGD